jgi:hypothetical protein
VERIPGSPVAQNCVIRMIAAVAAVAVVAVVAAVVVEGILG